MKGKEEGGSRKRRKRMQDKEKEAQASESTNVIASPASA